MTDSSPHVLICCLDTVRKDYYDRYARRLQSRADIQFEEMRAAASWSVPSHAAMFTGKLPSEVGTHTYNRDFGSLSREETWMSNETFEDYQTIAVSANVYAGPEFGFGALFDEIVGISPAAWFPDGIDVDKHIHDRADDDGILDFVKTALQHGYPLQSLANGAVLKALDISEKLPIRRPIDYGGSRISKQIKSTLTTADSPTLCFANLMDAHGPHAPFPGLDDSLHDVPKDWTSSSFADWDVNLADGLDGYETEVENVRELYRAEIDYLDRLLDDLLSTLEKQTDREIIVVITSDHGENLGYSEDDYLLNHTSSLTESLLHVPLEVINLNNGLKRDAPISVKEYSSLLDLGEITTDLVEGEELRYEGREYPVAEILGCGAKIPDVDVAYWDRAIRAVYDSSSGQKYVQDSIGNENIKKIDESSSEEMKPSSEKDKIDRLFNDLFAEDIVAAATKAEKQDSSDIDKGVQKRLEDLGYA